MIKKLQYPPEFGQKDPDPLDMLCKINELVDHSIQTDEKLELVTGLILVVEKALWEPNKLEEFRSKVKAMIDSYEKKWGSEDDSPSR